MPLNILSIDVEMKNLAICLLNITDNIDYKNRMLGCFELCEKQNYGVERKTKKENKVIKKQNFSK